MDLFAILFVIFAPLILTICIEYNIINSTFSKIIEDRTKLLSNYILINIMTNVGLTFTYILTHLFNQINPFHLLILEVVIIVIEAFLYRYCYKELPLMKAILTSALANILSAVLGTLALVVFASIT